MIYLFTTKSCKYCPEVKQFMDDHKITYEVRDCGSLDNRDTLIELGGRAVPAIATHNMTLITGKDEIINHLIRYEI